MMNIMAQEVHKGGETINNIQTAVDSADKDVEKGKENLVDTRKIQKSKNKWIFIGLGIMLAIAVIVIVILLVKKII
jgi:t-SNARE complex subunit (syntaxin)